MLTRYRLLKEEKTYEVEAESHRKALAKLQAEGADGADIRNAVSYPDAWFRGVRLPGALSLLQLVSPQYCSCLPVIQERVVKDTEQMIPRTRKSLEDAVLALEDLVVGRQNRQRCGTALTPSRMRSLRKTRSMVPTSTRPRSPSSQTPRLLCRLERPRFCQCIPRGPASSLKGLSLTAIITRTSKSTQTPAIRPHL